jgi:ribosomal protein L28
MMAVLSENRKKEFEVSHRALKVEEKGFVQGVSYFINKIPKKKKQIYKI